MSPLVAVQPAYEHPFTTARTVASFQRLHDRAVHLNLVAGGFVRDLEAIGAFLDHDARYERLVEHATIVAGVLAGETMTVEGNHYQVSGLRMDASDLDADAVKFFVSGSSPAGIAAATSLGAVPVRYPKPPDADQEPELVGLATGIRLGVIARDTADEAWRLAHERFPPDRAGEMKHSVAVKVSDSHWHRDQAGIAEGGTFWLHPVNTYKSFCPYLVGSHEDVAKTIGDYLVDGVRTLILDIPTCPEDVANAMVAVERASTRIE
ncbi:MAG: LLM class flavin-dependent oxidoreductase [Actinomycetota bacterium]